MGCPPAPPDPPGKSRTADRRTRRRPRRHAAEAAGEERARRRHPLRPQPLDPGSAATSTTVGWGRQQRRRTAGRWPSAGRTTSLPAPTPAANAPRPSTPWSKPPSSTASTQKPGSATCSPAYPPTRSTASPTCSPGTNRQGVLDAFGEVDRGGARHTNRRGGRPVVVRFVRTFLHRERRLAAVLGDVDLRNGLTQPSTSVASATSAP